MSLFSYLKEKALNLKKRRDYVSMKEAEALFAGNKNFIFSHTLGKKTQEFWFLDGKPALRWEKDLGLGGAVANQRITMETQGAARAYELAVRSSRDGASSISVTQGGQDVSPEERQQVCSRFAELILMQTYGEMPVLAVEALSAKEEGRPNMVRILQNTLSSPNVRP